jgi:hypothetical protein
MRKTMILPARIAGFSSQIQTRQLLKKKSEVFHPYQSARLDEILAKFNNSLILSHLKGLKQVSSHTICNTIFRTSGRPLSSKSFVYYHRKNKK